MSTPILATKLYIPPPRPELVLRPRLIERLNEGLHRKLTLISAPAGFGKTTLASEWVQAMGRGTPPIAAAWLSLDEGDNDPTRFLAYLVAALQTLALRVEGAAARQSPVAKIGAGVLGVLQSPQPPPTGSILTALLNEVTTLPEDFILVLDDYHVIDARPVEDALTFLLEHLPPQMHLVIATREDPHLSLARLRAGGQLTELRAADLRFTLSEAARFLNQVMGLDLSADDIAALEARTEGWIAGLQLAALALQGSISMQGHLDAAGFIKSFTGSHHFVLDYLVEEVLQQQSESVQTFLLKTAVLDRLTGSLCDALTGQDHGQATLEMLEHANLFIVPLDNERRWYRYHHLFADLLRQRLQQQPFQQSAASSGGDEGGGVAGLHKRASQWYEDHGLEIEAFHHAAAANDVERAARLMTGGGMPLQFRGAVAPVLNWLGSLPATVLDARPSLWVMYASALSMSGQLSGVEPKLQAAEAALHGVMQGAEPDEETRNLIGHIAAIRALLAAAQRQVETIIAQSQRALEYLHPGNLPVRTATIWKLGIAYQLQGERAAASQAYTEAIAISQASGNTIINLSATIGLGQVQEAQNQLYLAAEGYRRVLQLAGDPPLPAACEAHLGLARIFYEWNDLDAAQQYGGQSLQLAQQIENTEWLVASEVFFARLKLARGDAAGAAAMLAETSQSVRQHNLAHRMPEVAAAQVLALLRQAPLLHQGDLAGAAELAEKHELPISQARVHLAQGGTREALASLELWRQQVEAKGWEDERLKVMVLQAVALQANGENEQAVQLLGDALALAQPGGFVRIFVDEGEPMRLLILDFRLWIEKQSRGQDHKLMTYVDSLLAAFARPATMAQSPANYAGIIRDRPNELRDKSTMIEPLSQRELEVLQLIAQGLSNREIGQRLFLALSTIKGHNRRIYRKLEVQRRTEAVARARELGLL